MKTTAFDKKGKKVNIYIPEKANIGKIDETFTEIDLSGFLKDNPDLIADLRKKYSI